MKHIKPLTEAWDDGYYDPPDDGPDYDPERERELPNNKKLFKTLGVMPGYAVVKDASSPTMWLVDLEDLEEEFEKGGYLYRTPVGRDWEGETTWEVDYEMYPECVEDLVTDMWTGENRDLTLSGPGVRKLQFGEGLEDSFFGINNTPITKIDRELAETIIADLMERKSDRKKRHKAMGYSGSSQAVSDATQLANALGRAFPPED